ncbi:HRDC domain-containing protein [Candidatus Sumerlaeota bacterium]|nr:HRDC domain-containing protein [Candidatus Sumerlaeota bacterium]
MNQHSDNIDATCRDRLRDAMQAGKDVLLLASRQQALELCLECAHELAGLVLLIRAKGLDDAALEQLDDSVAMLGGGASFQQQIETRKRLRDGSLRILCVTPHRAVSEGFADLLRHSAPAQIIIEDAHRAVRACGEFHADHEALKRLRQFFPDAAICACSPHQTPEAQAWIERTLQLERPERIAAPAVLPGVLLRVEKTAELPRQAEAIIARNAGKPGLIYVMRPNDAEPLAAFLARKRHKVAAVMPAMPERQRNLHIEAYEAGRIDTLVTLTGFPLPALHRAPRVTIHAGMPPSLERFQQETALLAQGGPNSERALIFALTDFGYWQFNHASLENTEKKPALARLDAIFQFCKGIGCRHNTLSSYFGLPSGSPNCGACDICLGGLPLIRDAGETAQKILECVAALNGEHDAAFTAKLLAGENDDAVARSEHVPGPHFSALAPWSASDARDFIEQLIARQCLQGGTENDPLTLTQQGWKALKTAESLPLFEPQTGVGIVALTLESAVAQPEPVKLKTTSWGGVIKKPKVERLTEKDWEGVDRGLFDHLHKVRRGIADIERIAAAMIFGDAALRDMARRRPSSLDGFLQCSGVGPSKAEKYADEFIAFIVDYCRKNSLRLDVDPNAPQRSAAVSRSEQDEPSTQQTESAQRRPHKIRPRIGPYADKQERENIAKERAFEMFYARHPLEDVAKAIRKTPAGALRLLLEYIQENNLKTAQPWTPPPLFARIHAAAHNFGLDKQPKQLFYLLDGAVSLHHIQITLAVIRNIERDTESE